MRLSRYVVALGLTMFAGLASAATISVGTHLSPYALADRATVFDQNIESESAAVTKSGSWANFVAGAGIAPWNRGTWLFTAGSYVEVAFSVAADTLFAQFEADTNDGIAEFWVDGALIGSLDTWNRIWVQVEISGLSLGLHTMRIYGRRNFRGQDDLAFDNFGALDTSISAVPLPAGAPLLLAGLGVLGVLRRKSRRSSDL